MKLYHFFYIGSFVLITAQTLQAQELSTADVPQAITASFSTKYPDATEVKWKKNKSGKYEADFRQNGKKAEAKFMADGTWDSADKRIDAKDLPEEASSYLKKNYASHKIDQIEWKEDKDASKNVYEVKVKKDKSEIELVFSAEGKFLKKKDKDKE
jgi:hypothetical protein